jgi:galactose mutarotase-like enzyme
LQREKKGQPVMSILENDYIKITTKSEGAELTSIYLKEDQINYLWNANPDFWARHAPVLFPIVGKLVNNQYKINKVNYELSQHGFARDMNFTLLELHNDEVIYELNSNEETMSKFPFRFSLNIKYKIEGQAVYTTYEVINKDTVSMPFSIGAHPAFNIPLLANESFEDYYLEFEDEERLETIKLEGAYRNGKRVLLSESTKVLNLSRELFKDDALIFEKLKNNSISIRSTNHKKYIKVKFEGFPYVGIWTTQTAPFICIEPWFGIADEHGDVKEMKDRLGVITLEPNQSFKCTFSITVGVE